MVGKWQADQPYARCQAFAPSPTFSATALSAGGKESRGLIGIGPIYSGGTINGDGSALNADAIDPNDVWWQGYQLILPGQGEQEMLRRDPGNTLGALNEPTKFPIVTAQQWQIGCLDQTDNGEPGDAFLAFAPNGTRYTFNHLVVSAGAGPSRWRTSTALRVGVRRCS